MATVVTFTGSSTRSLQTGQRVEVDDEEWKARGKRDLLSVAYNVGQKRMCVRLSPDVLDRRSKLPIPHVPLKEFKQSSLYSEIGINYSKPVAYTWFFYDSDWVRFNREDSNFLNIAFANWKDHVQYHKCSCEGSGVFECNGNRYMFNFSSMSQTNVDTGKIRDIIYRLSRNNGWKQVPLTNSIFLQPHILLPGPIWCKQSTAKLAPLLKHQLYTWLFTTQKNTPSTAHFIHCLPIQWKMFVHQRELLREHQVQHNLMWLFHGSPNIDAIIQQGFRAAYSKHQMLGPGTYVTPELDRALGYSTDQRVLLSLVLVVDPYQSNGYTMIQYSNGFARTIVNDLSNVFVVPDDTQIVPVFELQF